MATTTIVTRLRYWGIIGVLATAGLTGCGEPGTSSLSIGLGRTEAGQLVLLGTTCSGTLKSVELGSGTDWWAKSSTTIKPVEPVSGRYEIPLPDPEPDFAASPEIASEPTVPFFVRVESSEGSSVQAFTEMPAAGTATFKMSGQDSNATHPIGDFPDNAVCG